MSTTLDTGRLAMHAKRKRINQLAAATHSTTPAIPAEFGPA